MQPANSFILSPVQLYSTCKLLWGLTNTQLTLANVNGINSKKYTFCITICSYLSKAVFSPLECLKYWMK
jgi:hypothetical protein